MPEAPKSPADERARYEALIRREARHWGAADRDPENPQLWDDPQLFELTLAAPYRHLLERAEARGGPVLELGCGDGDLALDLARRGLDVTGVDLSLERIARATEQARATGLSESARFEVGDLNAMALPAMRYACVVAHDALHHILRLDDLLDRVRGALAADGRLLVSDFVGAGRLEKLLCAVAVAALPTYQPYAKKWRLRGRLAALLASERSKRDSLARGDAGTLHDTSPFEGISQESIVERIAERFEIVERFTFCPYWYHALPKIRMPHALRYAALSAFRRLDEPLNRAGWTRGSYCFVEARRD
jgi:2-polyprenyl-3-methyl-5-hydroxy-6-metoxy-1,4-benzoquinol methylase